MSIRGGMSMAIERARSIDCTAMQIFVKNNMQWFARPLSRAEIRAFLDHVQRGELLSVFGHANYLINLAATNLQFHANSIRALAEELSVRTSSNCRFWCYIPVRISARANKPVWRRSSIQSTRSFARSQT